MLRLAYIFITEIFLLFFLPLRTLYSPSLISLSSPSLIFPHTFDILTLLCMLPPSLILKPLEVQELSLYLKGGVGHRLHGPVCGN